MSGDKSGVKQASAVPKRPASRQRRGRRAGVADLWFSRDKKTRTSRYGRGMRWRAVYVDPSGNEYTRAFRTKADAQGWLDSNTAAMVAGTWVEPGKSK